MYQQITVVGYAGEDPVMRYTQEGVPVANFNVAVNNRYTNAAGDNVEETFWFRITTWRRQAEACAEYVRKGQLVLVVGELKQPTIWHDKDDQAQATLEVTARTVRFLSSNQRTDDPDARTDEGTDDDSPDVS